MHLDPSWMQLWRLVQNCKDRLSPNAVGRSRTMSESSPLRSRHVAELDAGHLSRDSQSIIHPLLLTDDIPARFGFARENYLRATLRARLHARLRADI